jgi:hypothetical protein
MTIKANTMTRGDIVHAKFMPELGIGHIEEVTANARLLVSFEVDGKTYEDVFDPHELTEATPSRLVKAT